MSKLSQFLVFLGLILSFTEVWADDSFLGGNGINVWPLSNATEIEMTAEIVNMNIIPPGSFAGSGEAQVECIFILHNTGSKTTAMVGFPAENLPQDVGEGNTKLRDFEVYIEDEEREFTVKPGKEMQGFDSYKRWYVWEMKFDEGESKIVKNKYRFTISQDSGGDYWFSYILKTGSTWKGKIGKALISIEFKCPLIDSQLVTEKRSSLMSSLSSEQEVFLEKHPEILQSINNNESFLYGGKGLEIRPQGYKLSQNKIKWSLSNFEPEEDIKVGFYRWEWFYQCIVEKFPDSVGLFKGFHQRANE